MPNRGKIMIKKIFYACVLSCIPYLTNANPISIIAVVNGKPITSYDIAQREKLVTEFIKKQGIKLDKNEIYQTTLKELIDDKIKITEAKKFGISISAEEIENYKIKTKQYLGLDRNLYQKLIKNGLKEETFNKKVETDLLWLKFIYQVLRGFVKLNDDELDSIIKNVVQQENKDNFNYTLIPFTLKNNKDYANLKSVIEKINSCTDFENFTKINSKIGTVNKITILSKDMDKKLYDSLINIPVNSASAPVKLNGENTIFFVCDKAVYKEKISDEKKMRIRASAYDEKLETYANKYFDKLKQGATIEYSK